MTSPTSSPLSKKVKLDPATLERRCIDTVRTLSADMVQAANSGHPGAPMGCAPLAHVLWTSKMDYSPSDPSWHNRDRFVLSNGHACALQYAMLHLTGYAGVSIEDLKKFRQVGSVTPGHPENFVTDGVEVSTGPLGQGISNAVGMALAERHLAATFNRPGYDVFDGRTYVICGDGCLQEGVSSEACSLAGHLGLGRLVVLYDDNLITIDGSTDLSFTEDVNKRFEAYGWHVQTVDDVSESTGALSAAVDAAVAETSKPSIIKVRTVIGYGSAKEGSEKTHGAPLGADDIANVKTKFGMDPAQHFQVDEEVSKCYRAAGARGDAKAAAWQTMLGEYRKAHPDLAAEYDRRLTHALPTDLDALLPTFAAGEKDAATRKFSQRCLQAVAPSCPELVGGSADLTGSNLTQLGVSADLQKTNYGGRYIRFGVREHGMAAICNGMFAYGMLRPYCATFLNFAGYALGSIRVSALSKFGIIYIMTHDSIGLGEDGPTHQPVEMLESLRSMPNILVLRPGDCNEMHAAYRIALERHETPSVIVCSRQTVKFLGSSPTKAALGGYVVSSPDTAPAVVLVGSGSETSLCADAAAALASEGVAASVVSMMSTELFLEQSEEHRRGCFPQGVPVVSVEAAAVHGWHRFSHVQIGMEGFGASGPGPELLEKFGFSVANVVEKAKATVAFYEKVGNVPDLMCRPVF